MTPTDQPLISVEDVSLYLYGQVLFEHTCWDICNDQHWAVIGPNGSGKSILMRAICGHVPVVKGRIVYRWAENGSLPQKQIAYVSFDTPEKALRREGQFYQARWNIGPREQAPSVTQYLSAHNVYKINPYQVNQERTDDRAFLARRAQVTDLLGIRDLLHKSLIQLSDGERRKISIARALLQKPRLLILDNPFTGLDSDFRARLQQVIRKLVQDDLQLIVVTARRQEIPQGITHALIVQEGRVVAQGPQDVVLDGFGQETTFRSPARLREQAPRRVEPNGTDLVRMRDVHVTYGDTPILSGIDWTVRRGEHWALLGPNGSGKTTLLSLILGDHPQAYANDIALFGKRRGSGESIWEIKQHIGWVSPELHLYYPKRVSCLDVVCSGFFDSVGLFARYSPQQRRAAKSWMQQLGIGSSANKPFAAISEGEQRMVLMARALVKHPLLLVLDEPCQGLDAGNRRLILQVVDAVGEHLDTNVIYVTHGDELPSIVSHIIRLDKGKTLSIGRRS